MKNKEEFHISNRRGKGRFLACVCVVYVDSLNSTRLSLSLGSPLGECVPAGAFSTSEYEVCNTYTQHKFFGFTAEGGEDEPAEFWTARKSFWDWMVSTLT